MKSAAFVVIFAIAALFVFALIAPLLFRGADMQAMGKASFLPVATVGGLIGYFVGRKR